jgi:release factor glutamine methyltransferase
MRTIADARAWAARELKEAAVDAPSLVADLLLGFVINADRVRIISHSEEEISEDAFANFRSLVIRRAKGEPVQYIIANREFYGLDFRVTPAVLIPRPETEFLVESAINLIKSGSAPGPKFVDIGTGSGCISIAVAHEVSTAVGCAVDISGSALEIARENARIHCVSDRIRFIQGDLLECFSCVPLFDLILCNPPYIALKECGSLPSCVRDYEPHRALFGGESGLEIYERLAPQAASRLVPGGYLLLELGAGQAEDVARLIEREGLALQTIVEDLQKIPRCLIGRKISGAKNG